MNISVYKLAKQLLGNSENKKATDQLIDWDTDPIIRPSKLSFSGGYTSGQLRLTMACYIYE